MELILERYYVCRMISMRKGQISIAFSSNCIVGKISFNRRKYR